MSKDKSKTDSQIQRDVLAELRWDTRVKETDVGVEVDNGVVTLTGTVTSWAERWAAQEAAHRVGGVLDVANDVRVKLPGSTGRTDTEIAQMVRLALEWDVLVPHERIQSTVSDGVVTLTGTVGYWTQHDDAARCVRNLAGVRAVENCIQVEPPSPPLKPKAVRKSIEAALERRAKRTVEHVHLAVSADKVTLSGDLPTWSEVTTVLGAVKGTPGVRVVESQLHVRP